MQMKVALTSILLFPVITACTTKPGLFACDVLYASLDGAACIINCDTKFGSLGHNNYAYQRCRYDCEKETDNNLCSRTKKEQEEVGSEK